MLLFLLFGVELNDVAAIPPASSSAASAAQQISPKKTWEGALGAFLVSMALPWLLRFTFPAFFRRQDLILTGLIVGIGGSLEICRQRHQARDLGIKDMEGRFRDTAVFSIASISLLYTGPLFFHLVHYYHGLLRRDRGPGNGAMALRAGRQIWLPAIERLRNFPREPDMFALRDARAAALVIALLRLYHRFENCRPGNLPKEQSFVWSPITPVISTRSVSFPPSAFPAPPYVSSSGAGLLLVKIPRLIPAAIVVNALPLIGISMFGTAWLCAGNCWKPGNISGDFPEAKTRSSYGRDSRIQGWDRHAGGGDVAPVLPCYLHRTHAAFPREAGSPGRAVQLIIGEAAGVFALTCTSASAHTVSEDLARSSAGSCLCTLSQSEHRRQRRSRHDPGPGSRPPGPQGPSSLPRA